ncbi:hypothetical protein pb186bvf_011091 [Paramecium bursaria]
MGRTGLSVGLNKGFITSSLAKKQIRRRPSYRKGTLGKRTDSIRKIIQEVVGLAPYEKRIIETLKAGQAKSGKKAQKLASHRLGTNRRGKRKVEQLQAIQKAQAAHAKKK